MVTLIDDEDFPGLLAAAQAGDNDAVATLFRAIHPRLSRFLHAKEPRSADDLTGEVWMAVAKGLGAFDGDASSFRAWIFSIARRRLADHRRQAMRRLTTPVDTSTLIDLASDSDEPEQLVVDKISGTDAAAMVTKLLPADQAEVILLRVLADLTVDEVAEIMERPANWVRVTQHRALRRLADRLGPKIDVMQ